jgi:predicted nucleic acid-binding protein
MNLLIHDANILIDLIKTECIRHFFSLEYEMFTTSAVLGELNDAQQRILEQFISQRKLKIRKFDDKEDEAIIKTFSETPGISYPDATVYFASKDMGALLLTGNKKLRSVAESTGIEVKGIFWAFDEMKTKKVLSPSEYKKKLEKLNEINRRLPIEEFEKRK